MKPIKLLALSPAVLLCACGGSGSAAGGGSATSPTPVVAPAPTATPTPSPWDLSRNLLLQPFTSEVRIVKRYRQDTPPFHLYESGAATTSDDTGGTILSWDPASGEYGVRRGGRLTLYTKANRSPDIAANGTTHLSYFKTLPASTGQPDYYGDISDYLVGSASSYMVIGSQNETANYSQGSPGFRLYVARQFVAGLPTPSSAVPTAGAATWRGQLSLDTIVGEDITTLGWLGNLAVDFAARTVSGTMQADQRSYTTGSQPLIVTLNLATTIDAQTGRIAGTLRSADGAFSGKVLGRLFGPQAAELGLVVEMTWSNGQRPVGGTLVAGR